MHQLHDSHTVVGDNMHNTSEIVTLLHYLREGLIYRQGVYRIEPRGNTGLHDVKSLHVTAQEHVTGAMLFAPPMQSQPPCSAHVLMYSRTF